MTTARLIEKRQRESLDRAQREHAGPYGLLHAALERAESHLRDCDDEGRFGFHVRGHSSSLGTKAQDLILLEAARLVVGNPNGCRERFSCLLRAVADEVGAADYARPVLARKPWYATELEEVRPADHWAERSDETAREILKGGERG